jgi:drug/metabolite transporter (DMT)-like permease
MGAYTGEIAALSVAVFWTITALAFEYAGKHVGSLSVNLIRLIFAFVLLCVFNGFSRGLPLPTDATGYQWFWLSVSGLIGFVLGDLFLFKSYALIGSRLSMLIMATVPPITAFADWIILSETMRPIAFVAMALIFAGVALAVMGRKNAQSEDEMHFSVKGILYAFGGALGQSFGLILSKVGMGTYDAFAATQIRIVTGILGFAFIIILLGRTKNVLRAVTNVQAMKGITIGSFFGPFLGVSLSLYSLKYTSAGIASTLMAIVPVLIIFPSVFMFKQKITKAEVLGAVISVVGVALFFM